MIRDDFTIFLNNSFCERTERELRLSPDEVKFITEHYPKVTIQYLSHCQDGKDWFLVTVHGLYAN